MVDQWHKAARLDEIMPNEMLEVTVSDISVCLYNLDGQIYATAALCTHGEASLADGVIIGNEVECPFHQGMFDIRSGAATAAPCTEALRTYSVKIEKGEVYIQMED